MNVLIKAQNDPTAAPYQVDTESLRREMIAAVGDAGNPQRWHIDGSPSEATIYFDDSIQTAAVQAVLDAHVSSAAVAKRATNSAIEAQIVALEARITNRMLRDAAAGKPAQVYLDIVAKIDALRAQRIA